MFFEGNSITIIFFYYFQLNNWHSVTGTPACVLFLKGGAVLCEGTLVHSFYIIFSCISHCNCFQMFNCKLLSILLFYLHYFFKASNKHNENLYD